MAKNKNVTKAIEAIQNNDAVSLRKNIQEALVEKVRKALDKKEKQIAKNLIEGVTKTSLQEAGKKRPDEYPGYPQLTGKKDNKKFPSSVDCIVFGRGDEGFDQFTKKKVTSGLKPGARFKAKSTDEILSKMKCEKHQIQPNELADIMAGAKTVYVFVDPFHAEEDQERVVQVFVDQKAAQEWYEESANNGSPMDTWR